MTDKKPPRRRKKVTIYDIAEAAGVAPSTVSRAFARPGRVHSDTAQLIHETANRLGYRAKPITRHEQGVATNVLAFVAADIANPVFAHIMKGFQMEAAVHGYTVLLIDTDSQAHATLLTTGRRDWGRSESLGEVLLSKSAQSGSVLQRLIVPSGNMPTRSPSRS